MIYIKGTLNASVQTNCCPHNMGNTNAHTHMCTQIQNGMKQAKQDGPGDKFPPGRPQIRASPALLWPQAVPDRPVERETYPDSNSVWQGDLETDVLCHWRGAEEEMVSPCAQYMCL